MVHEADLEAEVVDLDLAQDHQSDQDRAHQNDRATPVVEAVAVIARVPAIDLDHAVDDPDLR